MRDPRERLKDILEAIAAIERHARCDEKTFENDELLQGWFVRHLQIIGEAAQALPEDIRALAPEVPWHKIVGLIRCSRVSKCCLLSVLGSRAFSHQLSALSSQSSVVSLHYRRVDSQDIEPLLKSPILNFKFARQRAAGCSLGNRSSTVGRAGNAACGSLWYQ